MKTISPLLFSCFILICASIQGLATEIVFQHDPKSDLPQDTIYLVNSATQPMNFSLSLDKKAWQTFKLGAQENGIAWPEEGEFKKMFIKVSTDGIEKMYEMKFKSRYKLMWSAAKKSWVVASLKPEKK
jgi:hypothetical protein